jgi:hypothetical protein
MRKRSCSGDAKTSMPSLNPLDQTFVIVGVEYSGFARTWDRVDDRRLRDADIPLDDAAVAETGTA